jgi:hypothetical protein
MESFPSNSHKTKMADEGAQPDEREKVKKVVTSEVIQRKKPLGKRLAETFVGGDAHSVMGYVVFDVLVPAAKDAVADAFSQGIERMLFGDSRSTSRRSGSRPSGGPNGYVSYNRMSQSSPREDPRGISRKARANHEFDEIILATRAEAEEVIERLFDLVEQYEVATVADLYELVGITGSYTDGKWGWDDMRGARVERRRDGYLLNLPKTKAVD